MQCPLYLTLELDRAELKLEKTKDNSAHTQDYSETYSSNTSTYPKDSVTIE